MTSNSFWESVNTILEPFFQSKAVSDEMRRRQTLAERAKHRLAYEKWGCIDCKTKAAPHQASGMCRNCYQRWADRYKIVVEQAESAIRKRSPMMFHDLTAEAQAALEPPETESEE